MPVGKDQGKANKADIPGEALTDRPDRITGQMKRSCEKLVGVSRSLALVLVGDFNLWNVC